MKNLTSILIVLIVLSGVGLGVAFFVFKNKKKEDEQTAPSSTEQTSKQVIESNLLNTPSEVKQPVPSDISIPHVDSLNRRFEFSMNYSGIQHKGEFVESGNNLPFVRKSFGTFRIKQRAPEMKTVKVSKSDKMGGGTSTTKGGATKMSGGTTTTNTKGGAAKSIEVQIPTPSDWVDLEIRDNQNRLLNGLAVNLATGAQIGALPPTEWDGN